ncbi:MAG: MoaD/ThiS family protein [Candidatus Izimaplasma sp.]|nr:MoaD/ThiS family protein [Candidatus Izimaplasma bacterium]
MVKVTFYSLLRSNYNIKEEFVEPGSINDIIDQIVKKHSNIEKSSFRYSVAIYKGKPIHHYGFNTIIEDGEDIIFTQFVGGG